MTKAGIIAPRSAASPSQRRPHNTRRRERWGAVNVSGITANKDIDSVAGNAEISIGNPNEYASMEASVKAGDLNVGAFAGAKTEDSFGLLQRASWSGKGKYTLKAILGAGNLVLRK